MLLIANEFLRFKIFCQIKYKTYVKCYSAVPINNKILLPNKIYKQRLTKILHPNFDLFLLSVEDYLLILTFVNTDHILFSQL